MKADAKSTPTKPMCRMAGGKQKRIEPSSGLVISKPPVHLSLYIYMYDAGDRFSATIGQG